MQCAKYRILYLGCALADVVGNYNYKTYCLMVKELPQLLYVTYFFYSACNSS